MAAKIFTHKQTNRGNMTQSNFLELCDKHCILPGIALENDALIEALKNKEDEEVNRILREEF